MADAKIQTPNANQREDVADLTAVELASPGPRAGVKVLGRSGITQATIGLILTLSLPALVEKLLEAAIGLTDTIVAGHTGVSSAQVAAATAAVGTMTYLQWFMGIMTSSLGVGATAIVARSVGAGDLNQARRVAGTTITAALIMGIVVAAFMFIFAPFVVHCTGLRELAADYGVKYLRIMTLTIFLQTAAQIGTACLRGSGDTIRPMLITGAIALVNGIASPMFTFGWFGAPRWGIEGNAFGTMLAFLVSGIATLTLLVTGFAGLRLRAHHFKIIPELLWRVLRISVPSWAEGMLLWFGQFAIVIAVINANDKAVGMVGATMAAHTTVLRIESIAFLPGFGFGIAASALVGQFLGAKLPEEAKRAAFLTLRLTVITMTLLAVPMCFFPHYLLGVLVNSPTVIAVGTVPMIFAGLAQPGFAVAIIMGSALRGAGETVRPMISTILGMFAVRVPVLFAALLWFYHIGHPAWGLLAVWIGITVDLFFRGVFNTTVFLREGWMHKVV